MNETIKGLMLTEHEITIYLESGALLSYAIRSATDVQAYRGSYRLEAIIGATITGIEDHEEYVEITLADGWMNIDKAWGR